MILANVCAARFLKKHKIPALHRVHDVPAADRLEDVRTFLGGLGLSLGGGLEPEPADYAQVLAQIQGRPDAHLIQTVLLRSLSQAVYSPDTIGHFGLAQDDYAHFTSPIRRYPDLLVHRAIRQCAAGRQG
ncbi:MAG: RNB domain-containing ribonuclease [Thiolinea sp.]